MTDFGLLYTSSGFVVFTMGLLFVGFVRRYNSANIMFYYFMHRIIIQFLESNQVNSINFNLKDL